MSGGGGSQNTVTSSTQIPAYEQDFSQNIQNQAQDLAAQPYPVYQGALQAGFSPDELAAFQQVEGAAGIQNPQNTAASQMMSSGYNAQDTGGTAELQDQAIQPLDVALQGEGSQMIGQGNNTLTQAQQLNPGNAQALSQYMSPYVQQALSPQILQMETQLGQQQQATNAQATEAGAFGDARQGVANSLNNYYGDQTLAGIESAGYNTAFTNALNSLNQQQQNVINIGGQQIAGGTAMGNLGTNVGQAGANIGQAGAEMGTLGVNQANIGGQEAALGNTEQQEALTGANALYDSGQIQQNQNQQALNLAYQQYQNQVQWPYQMENVEESALSNSPYSIVNQVTLPGASAASSLGQFGQLAGSLGSLLSSGGGSAANTNPFGSPANPG